ncbi:MAG: hypothetical protein R2827_01820 [Bdellovibrionales bacterium]
MGTHLEYNRKINLISDNTNADEVHFADSIIAYEAFKDLNNSEVV